MFHARNFSQRLRHLVPREMGCVRVPGRAFGITICLTMVFLSTGCVRRRMTVRTSPPGATVSVDNQLIGTSPAATSFVYYGTREIRIEKDGFRTETIRRKVKPPWYQWPVAEFVSETLWPGEIRDERIIDVELVPQVIESSEDVLNRAEHLRGQAIGS
ncbi:hypothetical protein FHS27_002187 [Rhodopirellula rubra]|uniref:PEGA domain-containing protein n=1 Tax=Aporhodopirellula rubra TaxID=980271 RepID=A0A7W5H5L6_9BACT|nr:PEGA domain-containing protein [Aporhodopirellula rubra]MBB3206378.1 hypothetical protein [Aporhodopirellula rubra]